MSDDLRYPIGLFVPTARLTPELREDAIGDVAALPQTMRNAVAGLTEAQLDAPYRPGGWTVRQLVHHVADSHAHGYIRLKFALAEDNPSIMAYQEAVWANLPDSRLPVDVSLRVLDGVHARWEALWRAMDPGAFARTFRHPEIEGPVTLDRHLALYAWHSRHHVAHVTALRRRQGW